MNRRHHRRRAVQLHVIGASLAASTPCCYHAVARNLSAGGMQLMAERSYPAQTPVMIAVEDKEHGWTRASVHVGAVAWAEPLPGEQGYVLGIAFGEDGIPP